MTPLLWGWFERMCVLKILSLEIFASEIVKNAVLFSGDIVPKPGSLHSKPNTETLRSASEKELIHKAAKQGEGLDRPPRRQGGWDIYGISRVVLGVGKRMGSREKEGGNRCSAQAYLGYMLLHVQKWGHLA